MRRNKGYNNNYIHVAVQGDKLYKVLFIQGIIYRYIYIYIDILVYRVLGLHRVITVCP
jgi:hypothetical protein